MILYNTQIRVQRLVDASKTLAELAESLDQCFGEGARVSKTRLWYNFTQGKKVVIGMINQWQSVTIFVSGEPDPSCNVPTNYQSLELP